MASGLFALLDDVAAIAKLAAASVDDVAAAAGKAGVKAAGVVVDDAAVTPGYAMGFTPERELPIVLKIARGSLKNKFLFLLPAALALSAFAPWALTPLLMIGGAYLCFEAAEKVLEKLGGHHGVESADELALSSEEREKQMVAGAIRTDFILSAEIMAISLAEVADRPLAIQAGALALAGLAITVVVYGAVALIVKMDDVGVHLAARPSAAARRTGRALVLAMPKVLGGLAVIGTAAMLWVGGGIVLHGLHEFHLTPLPEWAEAAEHAAHGALPGFAGAAAGWLTHAVLAALFGLALGAVIAAAWTAVQKARGRPAH